MTKASARNEWVAGLEEGNSVVENAEGIKQTEILKIYNIWKFLFIVFTLCSSLFDLVSTKDALQIFKTSHFTNVPALTLQIF